MNKLELLSKAQLVSLNLSDFSNRYNAEMNKHEISCPKDCGACCQSSTIEASPIEFLPLAFFLYEKGELEKTLEEVIKRKEEKNPLCPFYQSELHCSVYEFRPFVCRAFGVFKQSDKYGKERIGTCPKMLGAPPQSLDLPTMELWKREFSTHFSPQENEIMPINQAIDECFSHFLFLTSLDKESDL